MMTMTGATLFHTPYTIQASGHYDDGQVTGDDVIVPGSSSSGSSSGSIGAADYPSLPPSPPLPAIDETHCRLELCPSRMAATLLLA